MTLFQYKARNRKGVLVTGNMDAPSSAVVNQELARMGHFPTSIVSLGGDKAQEKKSGGGSDFFNKVTPQELVLFTRQLATLFNAGISLLGALTSLGEQIENPKFRAILRQIRLEVEGGRSFSDTLMEHPKVFSPLYVSLIQAGEEGGVIDQMLRRLADILEKQTEIDNKITAAMRYPKMVTGAVFLAIAVLMAKVVPIFVNIFAKARIELPLATRLLIAFHSFLTSYWYILLVVAGLSYFGFRRWVRTADGKRQWDQFTLKVPILGPLVLRSSMAKFARVFGTMQMSGVPILDTIDISARVVDNEIVAAVIRGLRANVEEGMGLAATLQQSKIVPALVIQMISAGEESGALDQMLMKVADFYDEEVDRAIKQLSAMIEPILIVVMGGIVLFLALAIFLPMWDMSKLTKGH
jgi:type II secretory pathway component PulF